MNRRNGGGRGSSWMAVVALVVIALATVRPDSAAGQHQMQGKTWIWRNYLGTWNTKDIQWQTCEMSDYEYNLAGVAFNNWRARFGRGIYHTYVGQNCDPANDNSLRVWATTDLNVIQENCGGVDYVIACFKPYSCIDDRGRWSQWCSPGVQKVLQARIVYNRDALLNDAGLGENPLAQIHVFGHEFGHGMGLEDHGPCNEPLVMTQGGCTSMVNAGAYPNDVCVPDRLLGYAPLRC